MAHSNNMYSSLANEPSTSLVPPSNPSDSPTPPAPLVIFATDTKDFALVFKTESSKQISQSREDTASLLPHGQHTTCQSVSSTHQIGHIISDLIQRNRCNAPEDNIICTFYTRQPFAAILNQVNHTNFGECELCPGRQTRGRSFVCQHYDYCLQCKAMHGRDKCSCHFIQDANLPGFPGWSFVSMKALEEELIWHTALALRASTTNSPLDNANSYESNASLQPLSPFSDFWSNALVSFPPGASQDMTTPKPSPKTARRSPCPNTSPDKSHKRNDKTVLTLPSALISIPPSALVSPLVKSTVKHTVSAPASPRQREPTTPSSWADSLPSITFDKRYYSPDPNRLPGPRPASPPVIMDLPLKFPPPSTTRLISPLIANPNTPKIPKLAPFQRAKLLNKPTFSPSSQTTNRSSIPTSQPSIETDYSCLKDLPRSIAACRDWKFKYGQIDPEKFPIKHRRHFKDILRIDVDPSTWAEEVPSFTKL